MQIITLTPELQRLLDEAILSSGSHSSFEAGCCAMELAAKLAGERHTDTPQCACPVLTNFMISWNDGLPDDETRARLLKPLIPRVIGTRSTLEVEERRAFLAMDWIVRTFTPAWLDLIDDLQANAVALRALDAIHDLATLDAATPSLRSAADRAAAASAAAWDAARDAAWDAAWDAASAAARDAARDAAWDAAWDAASAAARDAARDAASAAARARLAPTVLALQTSARELFERMLAVQPANADATA